MHRIRPHATALLLLLLTVTSISLINLDASASAPLTSADLLHREGNQLVNSLGTPVILRGTTGDFVHNPQGGWMTTRGFKLGISAVTEQLDLMQNWGFNSMRITMAVEPWLRNTDNNRANLRSVISQAQQRGMYVTVAPYSVLYSGDASGEWQSNGLPYPPYQGDQSYQTLVATQAVIPDKQSFINFYDQLVNDLKGYPNVLFELWNEPHASYYAGQAAIDDFFATVVNPIIINARSSGAQQPFVMDENWGGINTGSYMNNMARISDSNIAMSFHIYSQYGHLDTWGNPTDYTGLMNAFTSSGVISASKIYPIYFAEMGIYAGSVSQRTQYDNILRICSEQGWSWGAWWFQDTNIFAFVDSKANPTAEGLVYQKWLDLAVPQPSNTPTPTPTAPPTATPTPPPTPTPTATPTPKPMATPTSTPLTPTPTQKPSNTPTPAPTPNPTATPTPKPTVTATPTPTLTITITPTSTPAPSLAPTHIPSPSPTTTPTTQTPQPSPNPTTPNPTPKPTETPAPQTTTTTQPTLNQTDAAKTDSTNQNIPRQIGLYIVGLATPAVVAFAFGLTLVMRKKAKLPVT